MPVIILMVHAILVVACLYLIFLGRISLRKEHVIPVIVLPLAGPLIALSIEYLYRSDKHGKTPLPIDFVTPEQDILWRSLKSYHENGDIVPLEEAILIDDVKTRRKFMLQTLYEDPLKYLDVLMLAKNNEDVETAHYATTTISHTQRVFQLATQKLAAAVKAQPDDIELLDQYIEALGKYIDSGLLEEHLLRNLRLVYQETLDKKLARIKNDKSALIRKLRNSINLRDYTSALSTSDLLQEQWPEDEQTWIESLRVCVEGEDHLRLAEIVDEIKKSNINWTKQGKEQISTWVEGMRS
jgi:hypothetical protein